jgi:hypothetical protein
VAIYAKWLPIDALLISLTKYFRLVRPEEMTFFAEDIDCKAPVLEFSSEQLCKNGSEHDQHEYEKHHNIEHDWQAIEDG